MGKDGKYSRQGDAQPANIAIIIPNVTRQGNDTGDDEEASEAKVHQVDEIRPQLDQNAPRLGRAKLDGRHEAKRAEEAPKRNVNHVVAALLSAAGTVDEAADEVVRVPKDEQDGPDAEEGGQAVVVPGHADEDGGRDAEGDDDKSEEEDG